MYVCLLSPCILDPSALRKGWRLYALDTLWNHTEGANREQSALLLISAKRNEQPCWKEVDPSKQRNGLL